MSIRSFLGIFVSGDRFVFVGRSLQLFLLIEMWKTMVLSWIAATFSAEDRTLNRSFLLALTHWHLMSIFLHQLQFQLGQERTRCCLYSKKCSKSVFEQCSNSIRWKISCPYRILHLQFQSSFFLSQSSWWTKLCRLKRQN